jgi:integrase
MSEKPEIDGVRKFETAKPGTRMKAGREHRVPLSGRALAIVEQLVEEKQGDFVFGGQRGKPLSTPAMNMVLRRMQAENATVHGFQLPRLGRERNLVAARGR